MNQRIRSLFEQKSSRILSVYFTAGYPHNESTMPVLKALQAGGIDMVEVTRRFDEIRDAHTAMMAALEKHGRSHKKTVEATAALAEVFAPIKLTPKHFDALVNSVRTSLEQIRLQERQIVTLMTRKCGMARKDVIVGFQGDRKSVV